MRKTFPGYYRPSEAEFRKLWDKCLFVLDANVLLNLYRYSEETRNKLLDILRKIESRLWVPHQAALEYQRNRLEVISAQREAYKQIEQLLGDTHKKLETQLKTYKRHPLIDTEKLLTSITSAFESQAEELGKVRQRHPDLLQKDSVREALTEILDGKIGQPYPEEKLKQIYKEGEDRYAKSKPPGYKDARSKDGSSVYGDLVLWFQVIEKAASDKVPVVIVTDDVKEDWWWRHEGKIVGPNPELVEEIRGKAKVDFYMYVSDQFMEYARQYLKQQVDQVAIDEIREVRKLDEQRRLHNEKVLARKEQMIREFRREIVNLDSEIGHLNHELALLNSEIAEMALEPVDLRQTEDRKKHLAVMSSRMREMETRLQSLVERRHLANHRLHAEADERSSLRHEHSVRELRMEDGSVRRIVLRRPAPPPAEFSTPGALPVIQSSGGREDAAEHETLRKKTK